MRRHLTIAATLALGACVPDQTAADDTPTMELIANYRTLFVGVWKTCDAGRAVYVNSEGGITVVENAAECAA